MAPCSLLTASVGRLAKSFSALTCTSALARCTGFLPASYAVPVQCLASQASGRPKWPLTGYTRYVIQQHPVIHRQNPERKPADIIRVIAQQWRMLSPEQKQPFVEASLPDKQQFQELLQRYRAQLTPAQIQQQLLEKRQRSAKRKAFRKKRELVNLGKPKRPRSPFNIFMSEHFQEAKGISLQAKMNSLLEDWRSLLSIRRQVYTQLAEDDKIRYKNEMKSWEDQMVEIGREDLLRGKTLSSKKKAAAQLAAKAKAEETTANRMSELTSKVSLPNTVRIIKKK